MKQSGLEFMEGQPLKIVGGLGSKNDFWERALSVVEWVYSDKDKKRNKSRFVYTKLLAVLRIARTTRMSRESTDNTRTTERPRDKLQRRLGQRAVFVESSEQVQGCRGRSSLTPFTRCRLWKEKAFAI